MVSPIRSFGWRPTLAFCALAAELGHGDLVDAQPVGESLLRHLQWPADALERYARHTQMLVKCY
jgi:hypothetical protein